MVDPYVALGEPPGPLLGRPVRPGASPRYAERAAGYPAARAQRIDQ
ncbi:hypothetical protein [Micromonospora sp. NPDC005806]